MHQAANSHFVEPSDCLYLKTFRIWYIIFRRSGISLEAEIQIRDIDEIVSFLSKKGS
jgi:hypothetical protein